MGTWRDKLRLARCTAPHQGNLHERRRGHTCCSFRRVRDDGRLHCNTDVASDDKRIPRLAITVAAGPASPSEGQGERYARWSNYCRACFPRLSRAGKDRMAPGREHRVAPLCPHPPERNSPARRLWLRPSPGLCRAGVRAALSGLLLPLRPRSVRTGT